MVLAPHLGRDENRATERLAAAERALPRGIDIMMINHETGEMTNDVPDLGPASAGPGSGGSSMPTGLVSDADLAAMDTQFSGGGAGGATGGAFSSLGGGGGGGAFSSLGGGGVGGGFSSLGGGNASTAGKAAASSMFAGMF